MVIIDATGHKWTCCRVGRRFLSHFHSYLLMGIFWSCAISWNLEPLHHLVVFVSMQNISFVELSHLWSNSPHAPIHEHQLHTPRALCHTFHCVKMNCCWDSFLWDDKRHQRGRILQHWEGRSKPIIYCIDKLFNFFFCFYTNVLYNRRDLASLVKVGEGEDLKLTNAILSGVSEVVSMSTSSSRVWRLALMSTTPWAGLSLSWCLHHHLHLNAQCLWTFRG